MSETTQAATSPLRLLGERDLRVLASVLPFLLEFRFRVAVSVALLLASTGVSLLVPWLLKLGKL
ncbi:MAG: hypothetical protein F4Y86_12405 [Gammaproteobacteria bacterium]|nr:hypothetical protein [Gammaproteobacteria bacterium]